MRHKGYSRCLWRELLVTLLAYVLLAQSALALQQQQQGATAATAAAAAKPAAASLTAAERAASAQVKLETIREITTALAAPEMQGRGTAQPGGEKAARYLADRFSKLGLKPLGDAGTYLQAIKFKSSMMTGETSVKAGEAVLKFGSEFVVLPPLNDADVSGNLVFVGYGLAAPELKRDDLAGLDVKGKIVILMGGRPANVDEAAWKKAATPQKILGGLVQAGALGIIYANAGTKEQPFSVIAQYLSRRRVSLAGGAPSPFKLPPIILASNEATEKIFSGSEMTFAQLMEKASKGEAVSRDLNKPGAITVRVKQDEAVGSNVVGVLEGSDPKLKDQAVVYTAHYDAYGMDEAGRIYPGAADNALGVAMITAIAEAFSKAANKPRRSVIFLAVTGEEYGLLGAEHWVKNPTWPIEKLAANLNFDGIGTEVYGPVKRVVGYGAEFSDLGTTLEGVLAATGLVMTPDPLPEEGVFTRSDHYAFVKKGVPALMLLGGPEGDAAQWIARAKKWMDVDYHQPSDTVKPDWNWDGPRTSAVVGLLIGMRVANTDAMPSWLPNVPYKRQPATAPAAAAPPKG